MTSGEAGDGRHEDAGRSESAEVMTRRLTWRYVLSLGAIAVLSILGQTLVQIRLNQLASDAHVVNLAGRQRMLSQRLAKAALWDRGPTRQRELSTAVEDLTRVHRALQSGEAQLGLPERQPSDVISQLFTELEPHFVGLTAGVRTLLSAQATPAERAAAREAIRTHETPFLQTMEAIVFRFDYEARQRVGMLERQELVLLVLILLVLLLEALFVFRRFTHQLRASLSGLIRARNALARAEADQQATLRAIPDGLARLTGDGRLLLVKASGPGLFGLPFREGARIVPDQLPDPVSAALNLCRQEVRADAQLVTRSVVVPQDDGELAFEIRVAPSLRPGHIVMVRDVSEQHRLEAEVLDATERARTRVGRELHDGLCQHLAGLALLARSRADDPETDEFVRLLDEGVAQARELAQGLYPATLTNLGLKGALEEIARQVETVSDLDCREVLPPEPIQVSDETALQLYRIAQEAAANAVKHAGASELEIRLSEGPGWLNLEIEDNGRGIPPRSQRRSGLGLDTMGYRARILNGDFSIVTSTSGGTVVRCRIPIRAWRPGAGHE